MDNRYNNKQDIKKDDEKLINYEIKDKQVMLFNKDNEKLGMMPIEEARKLAEEDSLDLVRVAKTPEGVAVCRILNYDAWKYQENKKRHQQEVKNKSVEMKEMWISPVVGDNDLKIKMNKCQEFLKKGHKVRIVLKAIRGKREQYRVMQNKDLTQNILNNAIDMLKEFSTVDSDVKVGFGNSLSVILKPIKPTVENKSKQKLKA